MKTLIAEDDFTCRMFLQTVLSHYGECHIAANGREAVEAFNLAANNGSPYDLICMDVMMPEMDGPEAVRQVRALENARPGFLPSSGVKVFMTTGVTDIKVVMQSFRDLCDAYLFKPIDAAKLLTELQTLKLVK